MGQSALTMCNAADTATDDLIVPSLDQSSPAKAPEVNKEAEIEAGLAEEQHKEEELQKAEAEKAAAAAAAEEEAARKREEETKRKAAEEKRRLERQRKEEEAREQQRLQEVAAREAEERAAEAERQRQEAEKARLKEESDAKKMVDEFLKQKRFKGIAVPRKGICGVPTLPLHTAVEDGEVELVQALLRCGADPEQKASGRSAMQVAERCNKKGSHDLVVTALRGVAARQGGA